MESAAPPAPVKSRGYGPVLLLGFLGTLALFLPWGQLHLEPITMDMGGFASAFTDVDLDLPTMTVTPDAEFHVARGFVEPVDGFELQNWFTLVAGGLVIVLSLVGMSGALKPVWSIVAAAGYGAYHLGFLNYIAMENWQVDPGPGPIVGFFLFCLAIMAVLRARRANSA